MIVIKIKSYTKSEINNISLYFMSTNIIIKFVLFQTEAEDAIINKKRSKKTAKKYVARQRLSKVEAALEEQFHTGRLLGQ